MLSNCLSAFYICLICKMAACVILSRPFLLPHACLQGHKMAVCWSTTAALHRLRPPARLRRQSRSWRCAARARASGALPSLRPSHSRPWLPPLPPRVRASHHCTTVHIQQSIQQSHLAPELPPNSLVCAFIAWARFAMGYLETTSMMLNQAALWFRCTGGIGECREDAGC